MIFTIVKIIWYSQFKEADNFSLSRGVDQIEKLTFGGNMESDF